MTDPDELNEDGPFICEDCGCETYDLEYIDPPVCKDCVRQSEIDNEADEGDA